MMSRRSEKRFIGLPLTLAALSLAGSVQGFNPCHHQHQHRHPALRISSLGAINGDSHAVANDGGDSSDDKNDETSNLLGQVTAGSRLSHAMLKVPSVDTTVNFWKENAKAQVTASSKVDKKDSSNTDELRSAFVVLGNGKSTDNCFALELVQNQHSKNDPDNFELGNVVSYLGVSKLIQYTSKEDLISIITGEAPSNSIEEQEEPNGMQVKLCASAPGDFFARFCLHTTSLEATAEFYTEILGMNVAAIGDNGEMLCLRYPSLSKNSDEDMDEKEGTASSFYGVPTTLVFEPLASDNNDDPTSSTSLEKGNCFDHLVIATQADIDAVYEQLQSSLSERSELDCPIFMKPTEMFGQKVIGIMDPNGFKVVICCRKSMTQ